MSAGGNSGIIFTSNANVTVAATSVAYSTSAAAGDVDIRSAASKN
jgi:hypothetical protein